MRLFFLALAVILVLPWGSANAQSLAAFYSENLHVRIGTSSLLKVYVKNPDTQFANITVWLGGDYPAALAKFSPGDGLYLTPDQRNLTVGMNPKSEIALSLIILSTVPKDGGYALTMNSNTTASATKDFDSLKIFIDYPPSFPGIEAWGIALIIGLAGFAYWRLKRI